MRPCTRAASGGRPVTAWTALPSTAACLTCRWETGCCLRTWGPTQWPPPLTSTALQLQTSTMSCPALPGELSFTLTLFISGCISCRFIHRSTMGLLLQKLKSEKISLCRPCRYRSTTCDIVIAGYVCLGDFIRQTLDPVDLRTLHSIKRGSFISRTAAT